MPDIVRNLAKARMQAGQATFCVSLRLVDRVQIVVMARSAGYDALYVDFEHGSISISAAQQLFIAALGYGITPLARLPGHDGQQAARLLEMGAQGVIIPHVTGPDDLIPILAACNFPPRGERSLGGTGPHFGYRGKSPDRMMQDLAKERLVIAMVESVAAIDRVDEIAAVDGVDAVMIGTNDLLAELALSGRYDHPKLLELQQTVIDACARRGKWCALAGVKDDPELVQSFIERGGLFVSAATDAAILMKGLDQALRRIV